MDEQEQPKEEEQKAEGEKAAEKPRVDVVVEVPCLGGGGKIIEPGR